MVVLCIHGIRLPSHDKKGSHKVPNITLPQRQTKINSDMQDTLRKLYFEDIEQ